MKINRFYVHFFILSCALGIVIPVSIKIYQHFTGDPHVYLLYSGVKGNISDVDAVFDNRSIENLKLMNLKYATREGLLAHAHYFSMDYLSVRALTECHVDSWSEDSSFAQVHIRPIDSTVYQVYVLRSSLHLP